MKNIKYIHDFLVLILCCQTCEQLPLGQLDWPYLLFLLTCYLLHCQALLGFTYCCILKSITNLEFN